MGSEDPTVWNFFGAEADLNAVADSLKTICFAYDVDFEGTGEILQVTAEIQTTPWHERKRRTRSKACENSVFAGLTVRCNVSGNIARRSLIRVSARSAFWRCRASGCFRFSFKLLRRSPAR